LQLLSGKQQDVCSKSKQGEPIISPISQDEYAVVNEKQCFLFQVNKPENSKKSQMESDKERKKKNVVITWTESPVALSKSISFFKNHFQTKINKWNIL
jgi:hypothetical protein